MQNTSTFKRVIALCNIIMHLLNTYLLQDFTYFYFLTLLHFIRIFLGNAKYKYFYKYILETGKLCIHLKL